MTLKDAAKMLNIDESALAKGNNNKYIKYIHNHDFDIISYTKDVIAINKLYNEAHILYYMMVDILGNENRVAVYLSEHSDITKGSWSTFLYKRLFEQTIQQRLEPSYKTLLFIHISLVKVGVEIKKKKINFRDYIY